MSRSRTLKLQHTGQSLLHYYRWLVSRGRYTIPLLFISLITPGGSRPDTEIAYTPFVNRSVSVSIQTTH